MNDHLRESFQVLMHPSRFFSLVSKKEVYDKSFRFAIVNIFLFSFVVSLVLFLLGPDKTAFFVSLVLVVGITVLGVVELFIFSISFHLFLKLVGGKKEFEDTFGVVSYSTAVLLYAWFVPFVVVLPMHLLYILSSGFVRVHKVSRVRALFSIVAPIAIGGFLLMGLIVGMGVDGVIEALRVFYSVKIF